MNAVEGYLHYWSRNIETLETNFVTNKKDALNNSLRLLENRTKRVQRRISKAANIDMQEARRLLNGKAFSDLGKEASNTPPLNTNSSVDMATLSGQAAINLINMNIEESKDIDKFMKSLESFLKALPQQTQAMLDTYAARIVNDFAIGNNGTKSPNTKGYDQVDQKILASLLGRFNNEAFKVNEGEDISTSLLKIKMAADSLPTSRYGSYSVRHQGNLSNPITAQGEIKVVNEIKNKIIGWLRQIQKETGEISQGLAVLKGNKKFYDYIQELNGSFIHTGGRNFSTNFIPDPSLEQDMNLLENGAGRITGKKVAKSDYAIQIGEDSVTAFIGFNDKNYNIMYDPSANSYNFKIQDETPLFTLMIREAGLSGKEMQNVYQIASAIDDGGKNLDSLWNELVESVKYRAFLSALAGLETSIDQSFYMVLGGQIYTMSAFIRHIKNSNSSIGMRAVKGKYQTEIGQGLNRSAYVEMNREDFQEQDDLTRQQNAIIRSDLIREDAINLMYKTKIRIEISLTELSLLSRKAL